MLPWFSDVILMHNYALFSYVLQDISCRQYYSCEQDDGKKWSKQVQKFTKKETQWIQWNTIL